MTFSKILNLAVVRDRDVGRRAVLALPALVAASTAAVAVVPTKAKAANKSIECLADLAVN